MSPVPTSELGVPMTIALKKPVANAPTSGTAAGRAHRYDSPQQAQIFKRVIEKRKEVLKALAK